MNLEDAQTLAELLMEKHLINLDKEWTFSWNNHKRSFGLCNYRDAQIQLSTELTPNETEDAIEQTILHEIAHVLVPHGRHGRLWKVMASAIGVRNPSARRYHTGTEDGRPTPTWVVVFGDEIIRRYYRKPARKTFIKMKTNYIRNRMAETRGNLEIIQYADYLNAKN